MFSIDKPAGLVCSQSVVTYMSEYTVQSYIYSKLKQASKQAVAPRLAELYMHAWGVLGLVLRTIDVLCSVKCVCYTGS